jgi:hypothetical protein
MDIRGVQQDDAGSDPTIRDHGPQSVKHITSHCQRGAVDKETKEQVSQTIKKHTQ